MYNNIRPEDIYKCLDVNAFKDEIWKDIKEYEVRYNNLIEVARKYSTAYSYTLIQYDTNKDDDFYEKEYEYYL